MPIAITAVEELHVGNPVVIESAAPHSRFAAVFEDDGETGHFYALDNSQSDQPIQDAMHIYDVEEISDRDTPSHVKIAWSTDSMKVELLINGHPHAVFDFSAKRGYCRSGFPPPPASSGWTGHQWSDEALRLFP